MTGRYRWFLGRAIAGIALLCGASAAQAEFPVPDVVSDALISGQLSLGLALARDLGSKGSGVSLSPYSVHSAVSLARIGATGATAKELDQLMSLGAKPEAALDSYRALHAALSVQDGGPDTAIALGNSIWLSKTITPRAEYLERASGLLGASSHTVDFADPGTTGEINSWVRGLTRGLIPELLKGPLEPSTLATLVNALYLKAAWDHPFEKESTQAGPFWLSEREQISHPLMHQTLQARSYFEDGEWQVAGLALARGRLQLLVFLPKSKRSPQAVAAKLSAGLITKASKEGRPEKLEFTLPTMKVRSRPDVEEHLRAKAPLAFGPKADFSALAQEPVRISSVVHEAVVSLDEKGIEAAAATAVMMVASAAPFGKPREPIRFTVDHPFAYLLMHAETGAPLFLGIVGDPREH